ncbi:TrmH family RNA methyltransferase, partial [Carnobacterium sp.]
ELLERTTKNLYIPIIGQAESLNVAVAAGILMFALTK